MKRKCLFLLFLVLAILENTNGQQTIYYGECIADSLTTDENTKLFTLGGIEANDLLIFQIRSDDFNPCLKLWIDGEEYPEKACDIYSDKSLEVQIDSTGSGTYTITVQSEDPPNIGDFDLFFTRGNLPPAPLV